MAAADGFARWLRQGGELIELPGATLFYLQGLVPDSSVLFEELAATTAWQQQRLRLFGREQLTPRLAAWYGDAGARYRYSGLSLQPLPWLPPLQAVRNASTPVGAAARHERHRSKDCMGRSLS